MRSYSLSFPPATEMFHFAGFALHTYGFSVQYPTMTSDGLPHSEISGSKVACHLPGAYRRLLRPSSPVGVEASTVCLCRRVSIYILNLGEHCILVSPSFVKDRSLFCSTWGRIVFSLICSRIQGNKKPLVPSGCTHQQRVCINRLDVCVYYYIEKKDTS